MDGLFVTHALLLHYAPSATFLPSPLQRFFTTYHLCWYWLVDVFQLLLFIERYGLGGLLRLCGCIPVSSWFLYYPFYCVTLIPGYSFVHSPSHYWFHSRFFYGSCSLLYRNLPPLLPCPHFTCTPTYPPPPCCMGSIPAFFPLLLVRRFGHCGTRWTNGGGWRFGGR